MECAPIMIPTLCRYEHFKRCVESLLKNRYAIDSNLYIALDYPLYDSHWDGYNKISKYIENIVGFKSVNIIKRERNLGSRRNVKELKKLLFEKYDRIIYSEDDNEFSANFLEYINSGLVRYKEDKRIVAICGHRALFSIPTGFSSNYYYMKGFSAWGYGMWRDRNKDFVYTYEELREIIKDKLLVKRIKWYYPKFYSSLLSNIINKKDLCGDGFLALDMIKNNTYCVYPTVSKVRNYGHDGSGVNCGKITGNLYLNQEIDFDTSFKFCGNPIFDDKLLFDAKRRFYPKEDLIGRFKLLVKKILVAFGYTKS